MRTIRTAGPCLMGLLMLAAPLAAAGGVILEPCRQDELDGALCGSFEVFENRAERTGRKLQLHVLVLPALGEAAPDPIFFLAGGPGGAASHHAEDFDASEARRRRSIVLVDQRGTGHSNPLDCDTSGNDADPASYLSDLFDPVLLERCRGQLERLADLAWYTTAAAMDDLNDVREALGYPQINLYGHSYGTRAALVYLQRHPRTVRSIQLRGAVPFSYRNPLYHARESQRALEGLFAACRDDVDCARAHPDLARRFAEVLERLQARPARATAAVAFAPDAVQVQLDRGSFSEAVRTMLYRSDSIGQLPLLIERAWTGDYSPFAAEAMQRNRGLRKGLQLGTLLSVVCAEDVARIDPQEIGPMTAGTFLGSVRVRSQLAACAAWPAAAVDPRELRAFRSDAPALIVSGSLDPVTPPEWGEAALGYFSGGRHVVVPGAGHQLVGPCLDSIAQQFTDSADPAVLDTGCVGELALPRFGADRDQP